MLRALTALAIPLIASVVVAPRADAYETWSFDDPIIAIHNQLVDIRVQMPVSQTLTTRETTLTVIIPANVAGAVIVDDVSAFPMRTTVVASQRPWPGFGPLPVTVLARADSPSQYPIRVVVTPLLTGSGIIGPVASADGVSNELITLSFGLDVGAAPTPASTSPSTATPMRSATPTPALTPSLTRTQALPPTPAPTSTPTPPPTIPATALPPRSLAPTPAPSPFTLPPASGTVRGAAPTSSVWSRADRR